VRLNFALCAKSVIYEVGIMNDVQT